MMKARLKTLVVTVGVFFANLSYASADQLVVDVAFDRDSLVLTADVTNVSRRVMRLQAFESTFDKKNIAIFVTVGTPLKFVWQPNHPADSGQFSFAAGETRNYRVSLKQYYPALDALMMRRCLVLSWRYSVIDYEVSQRITVNGQMRLNNDVCNGPVSEQALKPDVSFEEDVGDPADIF
ncbi:MAG: hypothetical protein AAAFM81_04545 [Pseudomonadota bacterium]